MDFLMVNHGQRYCSWARTHDGDDNDDDDDDGGVAQDGGHKGIIRGPLNQKEA